MTARSHSRSYSRFKRRRSKTKRDQGTPRRERTERPERRPIDHGRRHETGRAS